MAWFGRRWSCDTRPQPRVIDFFSRQLANPSVTKLADVASDGCASDKGVIVLVQNGGGCLILCLLVASEGSSMFFTTRARFLAGGFSATLFLAGSSGAGLACERPAIREATPADVRAYFENQHKTVLTLLGYSAADYEDKAALLARATELLERADPKTTIVNIGATPDGIGAVYELAKKKGFTTSGIVSTQARDSKASLSPCVDVVFFVKDASWGGFLEGTERLSPTSAAMVDASDRIVAIGGGEVSRDELIAAKRAGKDVTFIPADMNHTIARERALKRGQPVPTDFRGAAGVAFGGAPR